MSFMGVRNLAGFNQKIAEAAARGEKSAARSASRLKILSHWKNCRLSWSS